MKVWIKKIEVEMQVKNNGVEFEVRSTDDTRQIGDCYATSTGLTWCLGKKTKQKGVQIKWGELMVLCSSPAALKAAIAAAKKA